MRPSPPPGSATRVPDGSRGPARTWALARRRIERSAQRRRPGRSRGPRPRVSSSSHHWGRCCCGAQTRERHRPLRAAEPAVREEVWRAGAGLGAGIRASVRRGGGIGSTTHATAALGPAVKVGIVVPYSWSFWGGVVDNADQQARALNRIGIETRTIIGCDPPGLLTRALHPRVAGRPERPPPCVLPVGRTAIVPANGSIANIVLAPQAYFRIRGILERESFDLLHLHEPSIPIPCVAALLLAEAPLVGTFHASGSLPWLRIAKPVYGFLLERLDHRLAVSAQALGSAARHFPGKYEVLANGVALPERADPSERQHQLVFVGRNEPRKGLEVLLRSWPCVRAATGARLRVIGTDPRSVRLLLARR